MGDTRRSRFGSIEQFVRGGADSLLKRMDLQKIYYSTLYGPGTSRGSVRKLRRYKKLAESFHDVVYPESEDPVDPENKRILAELAEDMNMAHGVLVEVDSETDFMRTTQEYRNAMDIMQREEFPQFLSLYASVRRARDEAAAFMRHVRMNPLGRGSPPTRAYERVVYENIRAVLVDASRLLASDDTRKKSLLSMDKLLQMALWHADEIDLEKYIYEIFGEGLSRIVTHQNADNVPEFSGPDPQWLLFVYEALQEHYGETWYSSF